MKLIIEKQEVIVNTKRISRDLKQVLESDKENYDSIVDRFLIEFDEQVLLGFNKITIFNNQTKIRTFFLECKIDVFKRMNLD